MATSPKELPIFNAFRNDELLRNVAFRRYWSSAILNDLGSYISALALPLCSVLLLKASPAQMGMMGAASALPYALLSLPAGVFLDRNRKLPILLASKAIQAVSLASIPLAWWLGMLTVQWMYAVSFISGACGVVGGGAELVFLTNLIGRDKLLDAQSKLAATDSATRLLAPGFAGVLIQWLSAPYAVLLNAFGFLASIALLRNLKASDPKPPPSNKHPLRDIHDGFLFIWNQSLLRTLAWASGCWHMLIYGFAALHVIFATRELGMSAGMLGIAQMIGGIGVLVSSLLLKPLSRRYGPAGAMLCGMGFCAFAFIVTPLIPANLFGHPLASAVACAAMSFFLDCGVMLFLMPYGAMRQKATPDEYLGRIVSTMRFLTVATAPLGSLTAGYLGEHFSVRTGMACVAVGGILLTLFLSLSPAMRQARVAAPAAS
ncbi:MFS transporter [Pseudoduganella sp. FT26W]|uniref:MFS transporter n=1 Tax=Duganella aquatilis TaxID=2666082 RepID=A0A844DDY9_9BURK|nr:MFS transporter [Duganella aquatilis]MRW86906.1 MFS transporter [Duganella aquatilis]